MSLGTLVQNVSYALMKSGRSYNVDYVWVSGVRGQGSGVRGQVSGARCQVSRGQGLPADAVWRDQGPAKQMMLSLRELNIGYALFKVPIWLLKS
jgi:hypothetical protein